MTWLGDFAPTAVSVQHKFTTVNASGVPTTLGDSPTLRLYVNASVSGVASGLTLTTDFDSNTGLNHVTFLVTTSVTGVTSGTECQVVIATGSVSGVSLKGYPVCEFSLMARPVQTISTIANANVTSISTNVGAVVTAFNTIANANVTSISTNVGAVVTTFNTIANANVTSISTNVGAVVTSVNTIAPARVTALAAGVITWPAFDSSTLVNGRLDTNVGTIASVTVLGSGSAGALWRGY